MGIAPSEVIAEPAYLVVQRGDELSDRKVARVPHDELILVQERVEPVPARVVDSSYRSVGSVIRENKILPTCSPLEI